MGGKGQRCYQINWILNKTSLKFVKFTLKCLHFYKSAWSFTLFTPTFQYFYTDISAISLTFCNSGWPRPSSRHMRNLETYLFCHNSCCFVAKSALSISKSIFSRYFEWRKIEPEIVAEKKGPISGLLKYQVRVEMHLYLIQFSLNICQYIFFFKDIPFYKTKRGNFLKCLKLLWNKSKEVGFLWRGFASRRGRGERGGLTQRIDDMDTWLSPIVGSSFSTQKCVIRDKTA